MKFEIFEDFEEKPCQDCGKLTVCLFMVGNRKVFVCDTCVRAKLREKVAQA